MNTPSVSLVIPARNAASTIGACLQAVVPLLEAGQLDEIIVVDDGSDDDTADIVAGFPVHVIHGKGEGPGAARNLGWRSANCDLTWFIDSDCVAQPDALELLRPQLSDQNVGGVGGSYGNMCPDSLLACLIHEEIVQRHLSMGNDVGFLATFNVLYRRSVLDEVGGFDESLKLAQDAELAFRIRKAGYRLKFNCDSKVGHFHPTRLWRYLRTQARQGFYRMLLYRKHPDQMKGDSYSGFVDHLQPPLAMLALLLALISWLPHVAWGTACVLAAVIGLQLPLTWRLVRRTGQMKYCFFAPMGFVRSFWRGIGMSLGVLALLTRPRTSQIRNHPCESNSTAVPNTQADS